MIATTFLTTGIMVGVSMAVPHLITRWERRGKCTRAPGR
jgi:hypothetical protein